MEFEKRRFVPMHISFFGWLAFDERLLFVCGRLGFELEIFDDVFGCLGDDITDVIETPATGATGDLAEIPDC